MRPSLPKKPHKQLSVNNFRKMILNRASYFYKLDHVNILIFVFTAKYILNMVIEYLLNYLAAEFINDSIF